MVFFTIKIFMMTRKHCSVFVCPSFLTVLSQFEARAVQKCSIEGGQGTGVGSKLKFLK